MEASFAYVVAHPNRCVVFYNDRRGGHRKSSIDTAIIGEQDYYLFNEGSHYRLYEKLGSHPVTVNGTPGYNEGVDSVPQNAPRSFTDQAHRSRY